MVDISIMSADQPVFLEGGHNQNDGTCGGESGMVMDSTTQYAW